MFGDIEGWHNRLPNRQGLSLKSISNSGTRTTRKTYNHFIRLVVKLSRELKNLRNKNGARKTVVRTTESQRGTNEAQITTTKGNQRSHDDATKARRRLVYEKA